MSSTPDAQNSHHYEDAASQVNKHISEADGLNLLINNAGINSGGKQLEVQTKEKLIAHFEVNAVSPILITQVSSWVKMCRINKSCTLSCAAENDTVIPLYSDHLRGHVF